MSKRNKTAHKVVMPQAIANADNGSMIPIVAAANATSVAAAVKVTFLSGIGQLTTSLFRKGVLINMQSISNSANIILSDVQSGDALAVVGIAAGTATIEITVSTSPVTPENFATGPIHRAYLIV